jgi:hypothetical protein
LSQPLRTVTRNVTLPYGLGIKVELRNHFRCGSDSRPNIRRIVPGHAPFPISSQQVGFGENDPSSRGGSAVTFHNPRFLSRMLNPDPRRCYGGSEFGIPSELDNWAQKMKPMIPIMGVGRTLGRKDWAGPSVEPNDWLIVVY